MYMATDIRKGKHRGRHGTSGWIPPSDSVVRLALAVEQRGVAVQIGRLV
jgi:hypothetical protein